MLELCLEHALLNWAIASLAQELMTHAREENEYLRDWAGLRYIERVGNEVDPIHDAAKALLAEGKIDEAERVFQQSRDQHNAIVQELFRAQEILEWLKYDAIARYGTPSKHSTWPDLRERPEIEQDNKRGF